MDARSLDDLSSYFNNVIDNVRTVVEIKNANTREDEHDCQPHMAELQKEVENMDVVMALLRIEVSKQRQKLSEIQELKDSFRNLIGHLKYTSSHIPERLPKPAQKQNHKASEAVSKVVTNAESTTEKSKPQKEHDSHVTTIDNRSAKPSQSVQGRCPNVYTPAIEYITVDEFEQVPKYMKGRLSYNQVNTAVDEINKAFVGKYKIMRMKKSTLNDANRKRFEKFKQQESKDTKGEYFVVDDDIKEFSALKLDSIFRSILTILRHCGRMKEIRGGRITRYACIEVY